MSRTLYWLEDSIRCNRSGRIRNNLCPLSAKRVVRNVPARVIMQNRLGSLILSLSLVAAFMFLVTTKVTHAYIEIGAASLAIQFLLASAVASLFMLKVFWQRITGQVLRLFEKIKKPSR
jgi:hypothetical protein